MSARSSLALKKGASEFTLIRQTKASLMLIAKQTEAQVSKHKRTNSNQFLILNQMNKIFYLPSFSIDYFIFYAF